MSPLRAWACSRRAGRTAREALIATEGSGELRTFVSPPDGAPLLRGPVAGAAVGLCAGWLLDLVPPGSSHLGLLALTYAAAGALAGRARVEGPVAAPRVAVVALAASALVEAVGVVGALAVGAPVALADAAVSCLLTATVAALVVPLVVGAERGLARRRYG